MSTITETLIGTSPPINSKPHSDLPPEAASFIQPVALTYQDAAVFLGLSPENWQVVKRLHQAGKIKAKKLGKRWVIAKSELLRWLER